MTDISPQLVEIDRKDGLHIVTIDARGESDFAVYDALDVVKSFVSDTVAKAIANTLAHAKKLLTVVQGASAREADLRAKRDGLERERQVATASLFGAALDARFQFLNSQEGELNESILDSRREREAAIRELTVLRRDAIDATGAAGEVGRTVSFRLTKAKTARDRATTILAEAVARTLTEVLKLDEEIAVLERLDPGVAVDAMLNKSLPGAFDFGRASPVVRPKERALREGWSFPDVSIPPD